MKKAARRIAALAIGTVLAIGAVLAFLTIRYGPKAVTTLFAGEPHPEKEYPSSDVAREIASIATTHIWAGSYHRHNGFDGEYLCIAPQSGFYRWHTWDYPPFASSAERGRIQETEGVLHLSPPSPPDVENGYHASDDFIPMSWGVRHYLIPPNEVDAFCRSTASRPEPRELLGKWLVREGEETLPAMPADVILPAGLCR
jgi:hypothetical protein